MANKKVLVLLGVFVLVVLALLLIAFRARITYLGWATGETTESTFPSLPHCHLFASPLLARPGEEVRVSAFLLNKEGRGVEGKPIMMTSKPLLNIEPIRPQTDKYGEAVFEAASNSPGQFVVSASYNGQPFPQAVTLTFK